MDQAKLFLSSFGGAPDPGPAPDPGDPIAASARFSGSSYLTRAFGAPTDGALFSLSGWVKPALDNVATDQGGPMVSLLGTGPGGASQDNYGIYQHTFTVFCLDSGGGYGNGSFNAGVNRYFRDPSAWYHLYVAVSSVEANAEDRVKVYVNGVRQTTNLANYPLNANANIPTNSGNRSHYIGMFNDNIPSSGYMAQLYFIDGQALPVEIFGRFNDNGIWVPVTPSGLTFGNNGYHLDFSDPSNPGKDMSPNGNDWTPAGWDTDPTSDGYSFSADSPTQNWATLNPLLGPESLPLSEGNLNTNAGAAWQSAGATFRVTSGKWAWEAQRTGGGGYLGIVSETFKTNPTFVGTSGYPAYSVQLDLSTYTGKAVYHVNSTATPGTITSADYGTTQIGANSVVIVRLDVDNTRIAWDIDGVEGAWVDYSQWLDDYPIYPVASAYSGYNVSVNYGQLPFTPPEGFSTLQSQNIPSGPIRDGSEHFQAITGPGSIGGLLYTEIYGQETNPGTVTTDPLTLPLTSLDITYSGEGVNNPSGSGGSGGSTAWQHVWDAGESITTVDMTWLHQSGTATFAYSNDGTTWFGTESSSGQTSITHAPGAPFRYIRRYSNSAGSQQHTANQGIPILTQAQNAFPHGLWWIKDRQNAANHQLVDSVRGAGTQLLSPNNGAEIPWTSPAGQSVAWCWNAGGDATSIGAGSIGAGVPAVPSNVSANTTAGFSIVQWTGNGSNDGKIAHGLDAKPELIFYKTTAVANDWLVWYSVDDTNTNLVLNSSAPGSSINTSTYGVPDTQTISNYQTAVGTEMIAYCWHSVPGYSAIGSYRSNQNDDGPFVYLGFTPNWIIIKSVATGSWKITDLTRSPDNPDELRMMADSTNAEAVFPNEAIDRLSNGFKTRGTSSFQNAPPNTEFIYAAFALNPFSGPTTAR